MVTQKYLISTPDGGILGEKSDILTKGNDEEYPTFKLDDGRLYSCHASRATRITMEGQQDD